MLSFLKGKDKDQKESAEPSRSWTQRLRDGLAAISLRDLADRVDLRQPSLYAYFDSKLALYDAMFADGNRQLIEAVAALPERDDPSEALVELVEEITRFSAADTVRHQLLFQRTIPGFEPSPASYEVAREFYAFGQQRLAAGRSETGRELLQRSGCHQRDAADLPLPY